MQEKKMPSQGTYLALVIVGFLLGIIWGAISIPQYKNLKLAISSGDVETAQACAKKIRTYIIIGLVVNVLIYIGRSAQMV